MTQIIQLKGAELGVKLLLYLAILCVLYHQATQHDHLARYTTRKGFLEEMATELSLEEGPGFARDRSVWVGWVEGHFKQREQTV